MHRGQNRTSTALRVRHDVSRFTSVGDLRAGSPPLSLVARWTAESSRRCIAPRSITTLRAYHRPRLILRLFGNGSMRVNPGSARFRSLVASAAVRHSNETQRRYFRGPGDRLLGCGARLLTVFATAVSRGQNVVALRCAVTRSCRQRFSQFPKPKRSLAHLLARFA